ncbi:hypothetical protein [Glycomyces xiaoerkulensis]|uniref:hypothetical protein n=1 Tax=Glycomyces xiaoerkulensis TaxID=2038139 RepID=UPI000C262B57|nr:hypothetical protein [Glycomyces xiaoerkulensis]
MSRRRDRRRRERIELRAALRREVEDIEDLLTAIRPHLAAMGDDLATVTDPFEAELAGGAILGLLAGIEQLDSDHAAVRLVEEVARGADPSARALLTFMALGPDEQLAALAREADTVLEATGVPDPVWTAELFRPVEPVRFTRITVPQDDDEAWLLALFHRGEEEHGFLIGVDHTGGGAITMLDPVPPDQVPGLLKRIDSGNLLNEIPTRTEDLTHEAARRFLDRAIGTTLEQWAEEDDELDGDDPETDYLPARILLLTRRLTESGMTAYRRR